MLNLNSLLLFSENPDKLVDFYKEVLQKEPDWQGGDFVGFKAGSGILTIGPHSKVFGKNQNPERLIFNFETSEVAEEFDRIKAIIGVVVITEPYHPSGDPNMWLATFADPDNNYFQLATPMQIST